VLGVDPTINIRGFIYTEMVVIQCSVSDMPSTGYVSIFCRLSVFLNFSLLSLEIWVKKSNFAAYTNLLGLFSYFCRICVIVISFNWTTQNYTTG
jgi:hypothetical protein